jgi:phosphohistidine phosphatase SixA
MRCRLTVEPLAARKGLDVELADELLDTAGVDAAVDLLERLAGEDVVLSTHGELVPDVVRRLAEAGMAVDGEEGWDKGSTWVLEREGDRWARARWLPPPGPT